MNCNVLSAIFKRNLVSYFSSPTGYVFICVFVLLSSLAAFWPNEFFNSNLANLDQLNRYLPYIMLVFIPAITMSIWAEERRQGTDELLLTIPATDLDVVLGKYLAAVAIFSVALFFSMFCNFCVLGGLGRPDFGLFLGTSVGYWMVGLAMLSVGMVASFLTGNLTVGFILGVIFNAPLVFSANIDVIVKRREVAQNVRSLSLAEQFVDFQRGVLSLSSISYFVMIVVVMLYVSVVLIGRRHWMGGRDGHSMLGHFIVRTLALVGVAVGVIWFCSHHDWPRIDVTSERLSSLSADTRKLIGDLDADHVVEIEAFVSPQVPSEYMPARLNLLSALDELEALGDGKIRVQRYDVEEFSDEAVLAEQKYGITPQMVISKNRGARVQEEIFMGLAFNCGLDKVVIPFIDKGVPAEYELIRSIATVAQQDRKKIGVLKTDAALFSRFNMQTMSSGSDQLLIEELRKQYDVEEVDASQPITRRYDALLAVQPSSLNPAAMENFIDLVKRGQPTAIFEDPFPIPQFWNNVVGTGQPKRPPQQNPLMMMGRQPPPEPKGDITRLWDLLGVDLVDDEVVWQAYNPYPKGKEFIDPEWVFVDKGNGADEPFNDSESISSKLQQVLFLYPGSLRQLNSSKLDFRELATTGMRTGTIGHDEIMQASRGGPNSPNLRLFRVPTQERYVLAAHIRGKLPVDELLELEKEEAEAGAKTSQIDPGRGAQLLAAADSDSVCADEEGADGSEPAAAPGEAAGQGATEKSAAEGAAADGSAAEGAAAGAKSEPPGDADASGEFDDAEDEDPEINVVLVADIDWIGSAFFAVRSRGEEQDAEIQWSFDNVTFVLNALDVLADDERFVEIRKRRRPHRTLETVEYRTEEARQQAAEQREKFNKEFEKARAEAQTEFDERIAKIEQRTDLDPLEQRIQMEMARRDGRRRLEIRTAKLQQDRDQEIKQIERELAPQVRGVQDGYKLWAALIPPIPPLLLAFFVFFHRRAQEREGVARSRLK